MNLNTVTPKNETEDLFLSITKNCEMPIQQTHRKAEETLEFKMIKPRETFHFNLPIHVEEDCMLGLVDPEVYNFIFNINITNNKSELYKFPDEQAGGISYEEGRDEIEKDLVISDFTAVDLQDDIIGPIVIEEYREQVTKRIKDVGYMNILAGYPSSVFQDLEGYLRTKIALVEHDIRLVLDKYNSSFLTYEIQPGVHTFTDVSEAPLNIFQIEHPESSSENVFESDDIPGKLNWW